MVKDRYLITKIQMLVLDRLVDLDETVQGLYEMLNNSDPEIGSIAENDGKPFTMAAIVDALKGLASKDFVRYMVFDPELKKYVGEKLPPDIDIDTEDVIFCLTEKGKEAWRAYSQMFPPQ